MKKLLEIQNQKKYEAFGKVTYKKVAVNKKLENLYKEQERLSENDDDPCRMEEIEEEISSEILKNQRQDIEKRLAGLKEIKDAKGPTAAIFHLKGEVVGKRKLDRKHAQ